MMRGLNQIRDSKYSAHWVLPCSLQLPLSFNTSLQPTQTANTNMQTDQIDMKHRMLGHVLFTNCATILKINSCSMWFLRSWWWGSMKGQVRFLWVKCYLSYLQPNLVLDTSLWSAIKYENECFHYWEPIWHLKTTTLFTLLVCYIPLPYLLSVLPV